ncbi:ABC transporter permease [Falsirhodobacter sp. alg1]|uniref:ABC transporter permease n=1 Tax=Falsirhodobacter sp. alg1 TaxID=1472418 RepID=UPI000B2245AC|nr:ABC transporter permease [Falsirhodobacter sp. alg1]
MADKTEEAMLRPVQKQRRFAMLRSITALVMREMATTYGRSPGGYIWAILEPIAAISMLTIVFGVMLRHPPLGSNFAIFYATGMLPMTMYTGLVGRVQGAINFSRPLLTYPSVTFVDAIAARFLLALMTTLLVAFIVFSGIRTVFDTRTVVDFQAVAIGYSMGAALALGIGTMNCVLVSFIPLWDRLWGILTVPQMLLSGVFYTFDSLPNHVKAWLWYNPLVHVVGQVRSGFYPYYNADYVSPLYVYGVAIVPLCLGIVFLRRWHRFILAR